MPPESCWRDLSFVVRSGLMVSQDWPRSPLRWTNWLPTQVVPGSWRDRTIGKFQCQRTFRSAGAQP